MCLGFMNRIIRRIASFTGARPCTVNSVHLSHARFSFPSTRQKRGPAVAFDMIGLSSHPCRPMLVRLPPCLGVREAPSIILGKGGKGVGLALSAGRLASLNLARASICLTHFTNSGIDRRGRVPISTVLLPSFSNVAVRSDLGTPTVHLSRTGVSLDTQLTGGGGTSRSVIVAGANGTPLRVGGLRMFGSSMKIDLGGAILRPNTDAGLQIAVRGGGANGGGRRLHVLVVAGSPTQPGMRVGVGQWPLGVVAVRRPRGDRRCGKLIIGGNVRRPSSMGPCLGHGPGGHRPAMTRFIRNVIRKGVAVLDRTIALIRDIGPRRRIVTRRIVRGYLPFSKGSVQMKVDNMPNTKGDASVSIFNLRILRGKNGLTILTVSPDDRHDGKDVLKSGAHVRRLSMRPGSFVHPDPSTNSLNNMTQGAHRAVVLYRTTNFSGVFMRAIKIKRDRATIRSVMSFFLLVRLTNANSRLRNVGHNVVRVTSNVIVGGTSKGGVSGTGLTTSRFHGTLRLFPTPSSN